MVQRAGHLPADVRDQPAAERDVQQLMPAANRQKRFALVKNFTNQNQFAANRVRRRRELSPRFSAPRAADFLRKDRD